MVGGSRTSPIATPSAGYSWSGPTEPMAPSLYDEGGFPPQRPARAPNLAMGPLYSEQGSFFLAAVPYREE